MVKEYQHTGACPVIVGNYGRVEPGTKFQCEMEPEQEAFMLKIGAVRVLRELPKAVHKPLPPQPAEGVMEFEGKVLDAQPTGWPKRTSAGPEDEA